MLTKHKKYSYSDFLIMIGIWMVTTFICVLIRDFDLQHENLVLFYILGSVLTAMYTEGYFYGILFALISMITVNFYFIYPRFSCSGMCFNHIISFIVMFIVAILVSILTSRSKENEIRALKKEKDALALYQISSKLSAAVSIDEILKISVSFFRESMGLQTAILLCAPDGMTQDTYLFCNAEGKTEVRQVTLNRNIMKADKKTDKGYLIGNLYYEWPLTGRESVFGYVGFIPEEIDKRDPNDLLLISQMVSAISMALDRNYFMQKEEEIRQENNEEKYKSNLLRSVSHDIRTPLAGIMGTSELLKEELKNQPQAYQQASIIYKESSWLYGLVQNILSLTRLQNGKLRITKELEVVEDIIEASIDSINIRYPDREVVFDEPDEVITAPMDSKLIQQTIINLIDNAHKHSPAGEPIEVILEDNKDDTVSVTVKDHGTGIKQEDLPLLFSTFYTTHSREDDKVRGFGLGLPIAEAIMKAHGGSISARNNPDEKGAQFTITLPQTMDEPDHTDQNG